MRSIVRGKVLISLECHKCGYKLKRRVAIEVLAALKKESQQERGSTDSDADD